MIPIDNRFSESDEQALSRFIAAKSTELESDATRRLNGVTGKTGKTLKNAGYKVLRDFFDGDQWDFIPEGGGNMRTYNYIETTVINYTAFMTNEPPEFDCPPSDITDPIEIDRAEHREILLREILKDNKFPLQFEEAVSGGSLHGDTFILGPFWNPDTKRIWFSYAKYPENIRPIFSDDSYGEIIGYIREYWVDKSYAEVQWAKQLQERGIKLTSRPVYSLATSTTQQGESGQQMVRVQEFWDDTQMETLIDNKVLQYKKHNWGFVPIIFVKNIPHPTNWNGISDVESMLDAQVEYNEKNASISDIVDGDAYPVIFGKNLEPLNVQAGSMQLLDLGDDAELIPDPRRGQTAPIDAITQRRQQDIFHLSGLNEIIYGSGSTTQTTGRALSVLMQSINNRIKGRQERWNIGLGTLARNIFRLLELYVPKSKTIVAGQYKVDVFFPGTLLRNVTDEINKFNRQLQSKYTTMKNMGVPSPKDEISLIEKEAGDAAKLQIKIQDMVQQAQAKQQQPQPAQPGGQPGGASPILQEHQNTPGENPAAVAGVSQQSPISPKGALAQGNQRMTGIPNVKK